MKGKTVLVTGGLGHIGSHTVENKEAKYLLYNKKVYLLKEL